MGLQEYAFRAFTKSDKPLFEELSPSKQWSCNIAKTDDGFYITQRADDAYILYDVKVDGRKTLYFDCFDKFDNSISERINKSFSVYVNDRKMQTIYPAPTQNGIVNLGTFENCDVKVKLNLLKSVKCHSFGLFLMDDELLEKEIQNVSSADLSVKGSKIVGNYTAEKDGQLFVSVTHNPGFKCKINGKRVELNEAFGGFISIPVKRGENKITVTYDSPMLKQAFIICGATVILAIILIIIYRKRKIYSVYDATSAAVGKKATNILSIIAAVGVFIAFIAMIVLIYAYPIICNFFL